MDIKLGARFRAIRHRLGWRQADLARRAGVSQSLVSLLERGHVDRLSVVNIRRIALALDADVVMQLRWRGGDLDRLVDEGHAALVGTIAQLLRRAGWSVRIEVSYSVYGERGSIDVLAWHPATQTLLVVEVKTELTNIEATLRKHDEKARLAPTVARQQAGWHASHVGRLLVLPQQSTARRRVERHASVMGLAYATRGAAARRWLTAPEGPTSSLLFITVPANAPGSNSVSRKRIRRASLAA